MAEVTQDFNAIRAENKAALDELAKKYETQITDLKEHIQKLSVDGNDKDSIIKQVTNYGAVATTQYDNSCTYVKAGLQTQ